MTDFVDQLCKQVEQAARSNTLLRPVGGGTKNFYGGPLKGDEVHMQPWAGILEYEPTELVITAKAGTPLSTIEAALAEHNQELAFEPPRFGTQSTLLIAMLLSAKRRACITPHLCRPAGRQQESPACITQRRPADRQRTWRSEPKDKHKLLQLAQRELI